MYYINYIKYIKYEKYIKYLNMPFKLVYKMIGHCEIQVTNVFNFKNKYAFSKYSLYSHTPSSLFRTKLI